MRFVLAKTMVDQRGWVERLINADRIDWIEAVPGVVDGDGEPSPWLILHVAGADYYIKDTFAGIDGFVADLDAMEEREA